MNGSRRTHHIVWACALILVIVAAASWRAPAQPQPGQESVEMVLKRLLHAMRGKVDVYFAGRGQDGKASLRNLTVTDRVEIFGRQYIRAKDADNVFWLINPDNVVAFRVNRKK